MLNTIVKNHCYHICILFLFDRDELYSVEKPFLSFRFVVIIFEKFFKIFSNVTIIVQPF